MSSVVGSNLSRSLFLIPPPTGMRSSSEILIYINVQKCLAAGLKFYLSSNGVVLTEGNDLGFIEPQFFQSVQRVHVKKGPVPGWEGVVERR
jgi:RNA:NAD 2''-phosphotransferase